jgi:O-succinylbenzoic acid--CoA ligase
MQTPYQSPLAHWANLRPDAIALLSKSGSLSYLELAQTVESIGQQLAAQGLTAGQHLGVVTHAPWPSALLQLTCLHYGLVYCPLSPYFNPDQWELLSQELNLDGYWSDLPSARLSAPQVRLNFNQPSNGVLPGGLNPLQPLDMVLTSASSGSPKAVVHSWQNHYYSAQGSQQQIPLTTQDCWLLSLPLFHIGGQAIVWRCLLAGATLAMMAQGDALDQSLLALPITHLSVVPTQLYRLLQHEGFNPNQLSLRHILVGGAPANEARLKQAHQRGFAVYVSYGSSEMSSQVATRRLGTGAGVGAPLSDCEVHFEQGEVCLRGKTLCLGYWQAGKCQPITDDQGWYHTRDRGHLEGGDLCIEGRVDNMFICGGENIQPEEIESLLLNHAQILAAIVVARHCEEYGERPVAFIDCQPRLSFAEIDAYLRQSLPGLKLPQAYFSLPRHTSLKVSRRDLTRLVNQLDEGSLLDSL